MALDANTQKQVELLTKTQVAQRLQMSTRTVYRKVQEGEIPAPVKLGHLVRWRSDVLDAWIENNCQPVEG
ncbi:MAG: helix-turn-helix transcriptional regulator [Aureliella sp.]